MTLSKVFTFYAGRLRLFSRNIRLFLLGDALIGLGMTFWMLLFNLYLKQLGLSMGMDETQAGAFIGRTTAVAQFAAAALALPAGYLAARMRHKTLLVGAQCLSTAAYIGAILAGGPVSLNVLLFWASGLAVFMHVVSGPFIMQNTGPKERTYVFSLTFTLRLAGGVIGNIIAGQLKDGAAALGIAELVAYRWTILGGLAFSLLGVIPFLLLRQEAPAESGGDRVSFSELRGMNWGLFAKAILPSFILAVGAGLIVQFMNLYLKDTFPQLTDARIGFYMSLQFATMVFGLLAAPVLSERLGKVRTIVATEAASIPFMLVLALTGDLRLAVGAMVMRAALMNMGWPVYNTLVMELCTKKEQGILAALFTLDWNLSWAISALIYGRMDGDYRSMFLIAIGLYLASMGLFFVFFKDSEADAAASVEIPARAESS